MNPSRRRVLQGCAAAIATAATGPALGTTMSGTPRRMIIVRAHGGWDVTFSLAPRFTDEFVDGPDVDIDASNPADVEEIRSFGGVDIMVNDFKRPSVTTFFERWVGEVAIVNGVSTGAIAHDSSSVRMLTGTQSNMNPDYGAIVGKNYGAELPLGYIDLCGRAYSGDLAASTGQVGYSSQILTLLSPKLAFPAPAAATFTYPQYVPDESDAEAVRAWLRGRAERFEAVRATGDATNQAQLANLYESIDRAERFRGQSQDILDRLTLGATPSLTDSASLAVDLLESETCAAVVLDSRQDWDTHLANVKQHDAHQALFVALDALAADLEARGMLSDTLVVVVSEMTRAPKRNPSGGKDHWPHASALLLGAGVVGGRVFGAYDDQMESTPIDLETGDAAAAGSPLLRYDNFAAGIVSAMGIDPAEWFPGVAPFRGAFHS